MEVKGEYIKRKYLKWAFVVVWMIIIFLFSSKPAVQSDKESYFVINLLSSMGIDLNSTFGELSNFIVRKCAHFTEYFILYVFIYNALTEHIEYRKALIYGVVGVFLYACTDEFHQLFVLGRAGRLRDVFIDTSGAIVASGIFYLFNLNKKNKKYIK